jgi:hypothetical protein
VNIILGLSSPPPTGNAPRDLNNPRSGNINVRPAMSVAAFGNAFAGCFCFRLSTASSILLIQTCKKSIPHIGSLAAAMRAGAGRDVSHINAENSPHATINPAGWKNLDTNAHLACVSVSTSMHHDYQIPGLLATGRHENALPRPQIKQLRQFVLTCSIFLTPSTFPNQSSRCFI